MCTECLRIANLPNRHPTSTLLTNNNQQHLRNYMTQQQPSICLCSSKNDDIDSRKSSLTVDSEMTAFELDPTEKNNSSSSTITSPASSPKAKPIIYTHKLSESFFQSNSPPAPISPISMLASKASSPVCSPNIHPTVKKTVAVDPIEKCIENLSLHDTCNEEAFTSPSTGHAHHRLSLDDFVIKQTIGTGSSARVHAAKSKINGKYYAIKAINKKDLVTRRQVEHANNEREILGSVSHPFLVKMWGSFQTESHVFLVMDYVPGGELFRQLRQKKRFTEEEAKFYAAEVTLAIEYLHSIDVAYRDLKPENILIDSRGHVKLTDFGFAKRVPGHTWTVCGTPDYIAPEIIRSQGYTKAVDWWSLGVLIFEMLTGHPPFTAKNPVDQYQKILECDITWPEYISPEAKDLLSNLLKTKASERFGNLKDGADDIKNHPWFNSLNFDDVLARKLTPPFVPKIKYDGDTHCFAYYEEMQLPYHMIHTNEPYCSQFPNF